MSATQTPAMTLENVLVKGDLAALTDDQRTAYYLRVCESLGLNPLTKPFDYIPVKAEGGGEKMILYATKSCTDQLRALRSVSVAIVGREHKPGLYIVSARATLPDGRADESDGAVSTEREKGVWKTAPSGKRYFEGTGEYAPLRGEALANAIMRAETKARRRVTLAICGLGMLDESEVADFAPPTRGEVEAPAPKPLVLDDADRHARLLRQVHRWLTAKGRQWRPALDFFSVPCPEAWEEPAPGEDGLQVVSGMRWVPEAVCNQILEYLSAKSHPPEGATVGPAPKA